MLEPLSPALTQLALGAGLGLAAGLTPGPLQTLVVAESLRHGRLEGLKTGTAPLLTDAPIVASSLFAVSRLATLDPALALLSLTGAVFLGLLAVRQFRVRPPSASDATTPTYSLRKAMLANVLNPNPYVFWTTVGGPIILSSSGHWAAAVPFLLGFYSLLIGSFWGLALLVGSFAGSLSSRVFAGFTRLLGVGLFGFAVYLAAEGLRRLGLV